MPAAYSKVMRVSCAAILTAIAATAPAFAAEDRFTLDLRIARQIERFQSHEADSLGLSVQQCTVGMAAFDFRVLDLPMKPHPPALHVSGRALTSERVFVSAPGGVGSPEVTDESPMLEVYGGVALAIPLGIVDKTEGAEFHVGYEGGVVIARDTGENFLQVSTMVFGFQRTSGVFEGSVVDVTYGHDDLFGPTWAPKRWGARADIECALIGGRTNVPAGATVTAAAAAPPGRAPLRAFLEIALETDGRPGPDSIGLRGGFALDPAGLLSRMSGR
jgi:hypothetical protein